MEAPVWYSDVLKFEEGFIYKYIGFIDISTKSRIFLEFLCISKEASSQRKRFRKSSSKYVEDF